MRAHVHLGIIKHLGMGTTISISHARSTIPFDGPRRVLDKSLMSIFSFNTLHLFVIWEFCQCHRSEAPFVVSYVFIGPLVSIVLSSFALGWML